MGEAESETASGVSSGFEAQENEWASDNLRTNSGDSGALPSSQDTSRRRRGKKKGEKKVPRERANGVRTPGARERVLIPSSPRAAWLRQPPAGLNPPILSLPLPSFLPLVRARSGSASLLCTAYQFSLIFSLSVPLSLARACSRTFSPARSQLPGCLYTQCRPSARDIEKTEDKKNRIVRL